MPSTPAPSRTRWRIGVSWLAIGAAVLTLAVTAALSAISYVVNSHNEHRLLDLQVKQTATVLQAVLPAEETPLASAVELAATNHGSAAAFRAYIASYVGAAPKPFAAAGLWRLQGNHAQEITSAGEPLSLGPSAPAIQRTLAGAAKQSSVLLVGPLDVSGARPRIGYCFAAKGYAVYTESLLPARRHAVIQAASPFSNLRFALYLGRSTDSAHLLETNVDRLPVSGDTAQASAPFGASVLTLVAASNVRLGGGLSAAVWWIVILVGILLAGLVTVAAEWLVRRRRRQAERLTEWTESQLVEQRSLARTLQQTLLPDALPKAPGLLADARYGFVHERHPPATVLDRLVGLIDVARDGQFATVLCGVLDVDRHEIAVASAGHLPPLVIGANTASYVEVPVGPPIGVPPSKGYTVATVAVPPRATVMAFTDGLVERPGEALDAGLERLRSAASGMTLAEVFDRVVPDMSADSGDDIAILGIQWLH